MERKGGKSYVLRKGIREKFFVVILCFSFFLYLVGLIKDLLGRVSV